MANTLEILKTLHLPIYIDQSGHKCHFKDVCIQLTKEALKVEKNAKIKVNSSISVNQHLEAEWDSRYQALKKNMVMDDYDSGKFWAG
jgi:hypothetical protein